MLQHRFLEGAAVMFPTVMMSFGKMTDTFFGNDWETLELFYCWKPGRSCEAVTFFQYSL